MSVIVKCGGGKSSGLYVWAKYNADIGLGESINNIALANDGTSIDIYVKENLYIKEDGTIGVQGEPYSTVSISSVVEDTCIGGMTPTKYCIGVDGNVYSSPLSHIASSVDNCVANLVKVVKGNFIEYVVSDNPNKYPSDGEYGNYYYVTTEDVTPEVTAQTPVITQIAGNLGVTITTPSGTNKQILQGNNANLLNIKNNAKKEGAYVWKKLTAQAGNFVDFVVSDSETAYPDGGEQDGYWYEKVVEGVAGIDFGEVTLAQAAESVTVSHKLGVVPSWVALVPKELSSSGMNNEFTYANFNGKVLRSGPSLGYAKSEVTNTLTETEVTFNCYVSNKTNYSFSATNYYWFAIA